MEVKRDLEKTTRIVLLAGIAALIVARIGSVGYAQTWSNSSQCESMSRNMGGSGMMGGMSHASTMGQSGDTQAQCQGMVAQCRTMMSPSNMAQCEARMSQQNITRSCC